MVLIAHGWEAPTLLKTNKGGRTMEDKNPKEIVLYEAVVKKGLQILNKNDFAIIQGKVEITRDGALKILSSLPLSYEFELLQQELTDTHAKVVMKLKIQFHKTGITREGIGTGICEKWEAERGKRFSMHALITTAETRAIKRAIETVLGGVINAIILNLFGSYEVK